ncbi:MAG: carbohydrate binding domain-containing protein [Butyrivibrio sp.]|nr:carbohydrate binding domain-containing protein [Butyrivibrio sp.]
MRKVNFKRTIVTAVSVAMAVSLVPGRVHAETYGTETDDSAGDEYSLVWAEEFDGDSLNTDDWNVETHEPGWVNAELQRYTSLDEGNIEVSDGTLKIKPHIVINETDEVNTEDQETVEEESSEVETTNISFDVTVWDSLYDCDNVVLQVNFGKIDDSEEGSAAANVILSDISLKDEEGNEILYNTSFDNGGDGWYCGITSPAAGSVSYGDGKAYLAVDASGDANWHYQLQQGGLSLRVGKTYTLSVNAISNVDRATEITLLDPTDNKYTWFGGSTATIKGSAVSTGTGVVSGGKYGEITSGRITTQNKHDFTYGRFEARAKVPTGQGYLPAFWLMATDEGLYGQWPRCGEIDIMEVKGQDTSKSYHTIHYGYSSGTGHKENQGTNYVEQNGYSDDFHTFTVDWDPGKITWYVDGNEVYTTSDWYTGTDDDNQITYPAPFDQNFYVILNLAVGGSWVGNPGDEEFAEMNEKAYEVDYVRVYRKSDEAYEREESYAVKPEGDVVTFREADESGNYVKNGEFTDAIGVDGDKDNWLLHLESDATGTTYELSNEGITITPASAGSQNYSVQLKQENVPMYRGWEYELSFDAYAAEERDIVVDIEGPDKGWIRYLKDTTVSLGTEKKTYTLDFTMEEKNDANGNLEFNLGKLGSTAPVTIFNVRLVHKSGEEIVDDGGKVIRPDGNYIYNGSFDQGEKRLGYWEIEDSSKEYVSVTNQGGKRELKVVVPEGGRSIAVKQSELAEIAAGTYELSFNARCEDESAADGLSITVAGKEYKPVLGVDDEKYSKKITFEDNNTRENSYVEILFLNKGTYYLDNLFLTEAALIKNGSFNAGLAGFSPYIYDTVSANYVVDSMNGNDNAFAITIDDTVADDAGNSWYVQLNQDGVTLEEGKTYKLSFKAKSSIERAITYACQQFEGDWTNYSGTHESVQIDNEWKTFTTEFTMNYPTDTNTRFNITMGSVDGIRITEKHDVFIDDISLVEVGDEDDEPAAPKPSETVPPAPKPSETTAPEVTDSEETTKPAEGKPAESKPAETKPAETKPAETKPAETKPAETKPAETKPAETKPVETKPIDTKPVASKTEETPAQETVTTGGNTTGNNASYASNDANEDAATTGTASSTGTAASTDAATSAGTGNTESTGSTGSSSALASATGATAAAGAAGLTDAPAVLGATKKKTADKKTTESSKNGKNTGNKSSSANGANDSQISTGEEVSASAPSDTDVIAEVAKADDQKVVLPKTEDETQVASASEEVQKTETTSKTNDVSVKASRRTIFTAIKEFFQNLINAFLKLFK